MEKGSFFLQNDALIAILIVKGREVVFWKARDEIYRVVGSEKTRLGKSCAKSEEEKSGFWFPTFPCVSGQTLEQGFHHFTKGGTRVSGFGLKRAGIPDPDLGGKCPFFTSVSTVQTLVKKGTGVFFWISISRKFQAKPSNTGRAA